MELPWTLIAAVSCVLVGVVGLIFNRLVALDTRCDAALANIDVQLKQRHALLPNLLEAVRGFADQERGLLLSVVQARQDALHAASPEARQRAEVALGANITQLLNVAESYPQLQSSEHFRALREEIADTENKIAATRRFLNASVNEYNATLRQFPANFIAGLARLRRRQFYDIGIERTLLDDAPALKF